MQRYLQGQLNSSGAGTGKTTVLKALYEAIEAVSPSTAIFQVALAGRAAQRMSEATGRGSMTIAAFLHSVEETMLGEGSLVVVDEVSMVDVILFYRLLAHIPPGTRLVLVGDPSQLPPIGPGLVLHALAGHPSIPQTELKVVKRQSEASGIPLVASAVRSHQIPSFAEFKGIGNGVSMIECPENSLDQTVQGLYRQLGGTGTDYSVQILSTTRSGNGGVQHINQLFRDHLQRDAEPVFCFNSEFGVVQGMTLERVLLSVGDLVMFTKNDYAIDLRNGSLGRIVSALPVNNEQSDCCVVDFEGTEIALKSHQLEALTHAYSITVHKSQGSQFNRAIIPIRRSRLLDQTLIYTAITRGVDQVVLVGDRKAAEEAILAPASAARRNVTLPDLMQSSTN
ncbi:ATP-dependent DNA helicase [Marinobacter similis]|nr:AAA family ATPase [Marinobacter similis]